MIHIKDTQGSFGQREQGVQSQGSPTIFKGYTPFIVIIKYIPHVVRYILVAYFLHNRTRIPQAMRCGPTPRQKKNAEE